jgi:hypothetical protein
MNGNTSRPEGGGMQARLPKNDACKHHASRDKGKRNVKNGGGQRMTGMWRSMNGREKSTRAAGES